MSDIYEYIRNFNNDESVIKLKNYYNSLSFMEILGVDRKEMAHSSFLAWLFNSKINYDLRTRPLMLFLDLLIQCDENDKFPKDDKEAIILRQADINVDFIKPEYHIGDDGRVDIYIQFTIEENQYAVVIENKVESHENEVVEQGIMQTEKYFNHFSKERNRIKYIYVFLAPSFNGKRAKAASEEFINISYSDLVKSIIKPLLSDDNLLDKTRLILEDYLKVLSKPNIVKPNSKSISMLGLDSIGYENNLIENIRKEHNDLGILLTSDNENEILKDFQEDSFNKLIVTAAWPNSVTKRNRNRSFAELGIKIGTKLYLAKSPQSNDIQSYDKYVSTIDNLNKVEYIDEQGTVISQTISAAAKSLFKLNYVPNGFQYFVLDKNSELENLYNIDRK